MNTNDNYIGVNTPYAFNTPLLKHSLPLDYHVNNKSRNSIWSGDYGIFSALIPTYHIDEDDANLFFINSNVTISRKKDRIEICPSTNGQMHLIF